ncbi:ABC transporter ATP-binding protein [Pseudarthrobacter sp. J75]|uniref:ABC transporter ATP-binding protein n=1 Tax=unclassified Pseudarthrobacter TaxID=2647000 RepID=UPI002E811FED|nr:MULTISPECIES: ABC transporter ATP-binding protein [unclassified Pseudarthrobacter]MEE2522440.1 ABC transporter ATP-binding protein [Pseudarthrobacter sp. J47]MEE2529229.1 ABC transporter ATP-binding protein [Pseudarthrobacter sp. J75]
MITEETDLRPEAGTRTILEIRDLSFSYGQKQILSHLSADIRAGEFLCIVGPSGAGKTTLLQCLAGLRRPTKGGVFLKGSEVVEPPAEMAVVFQDYSRSLMPWLTARDNITLPLRSAGIPRKERNARAEQALKEVGLEGSGAMYPWELSGGMQQRVAIARALAYKPSVVIMDEPFASVDAQTRADLEDLTLQVKEHLGITIVLVTHDIDEAVYLSDRVLVLSGKPASVADIISVDLGTERDQISTKERPEFGGLRSQIYRLIRRVQDEPK